jgi:imidazolonepropionase-like amidohydrolase
VSVQLTGPQSSGQRVRRVLVVRLGHVRIAEGKGPARLQGGDLVVVNARVWSGPDRPVSLPETLVIRGGMIVSMNTNDATAETPRFDADGRVVTSGFWNCHVHFTEVVWAGTRRGPAAELQHSLDDMLLSRGFTTVLDLSSNPRTTSALVRRIATGELRGPRVFTAGPGIRPWHGIPFYVKGSIPWYLRLLMPGPATSLVHA